VESCGVEQIVGRGLPGPSPTDFVIGAYCQLLPGMEMQPISSWLRNTSSLDYTTIARQAHRALRPALGHGRRYAITPGEGSASVYVQQAEAFLIDFYNAGNKCLVEEVVFDRVEFLLSVMLPKPRELAEPVNAPGPSHQRPPCHELP
jgi:hypothetical protein